VGSRVNDDLAVIRASKVTPQRVDWLWRGYLAFRKIGCMDGDPGLGKSAVAIDLTARTTTRSPMPDGSIPDGPYRVLILSAEDGVEDVIVPRLAAAGANRDFVDILDHVNDGTGPRPIELPGDVARIQRRVEAEGHALVIVDPLTAFLGGQINSYKDQDVRRALYPLKLMAEATGAAVLVVRHLSKSVDANPLYRGGGSIGIIAAARIGLLVAPDPDDDGRRVLAVTKSNLAAKPPALAYRVIEDELYGCVRITWEGPTEHTAADLLGRPVDRVAPKRDQAEDFLREGLAEQARPVAWLQQAAKAKGVSWRTVERAKAALEVIVERRGEPGKRGGGSSWWRLPEGQLSINSATTNTTPVVGLNKGGETAGQDPDSDPGAINSATPPQEEDQHDRHPPPGADG
jgi:hypothetical protein